MKEAIKCGFYLTIVFILHTIVFYFYNQSLLFEQLTYLTLWYIFLYAGFMLLAIYKNRNTYQDSGTYFKIAFLTFSIAVTFSHGFDYVLANANAQELNSIFLEQGKKSTTRLDAFMNVDPLVTLEKVELMEETIEEEKTITEFLSHCFAYYFLFGIPLSFLVTFLGRQFIKLFNKNPFVAN